MTIKTMPKIYYVNPLSSGNNLLNFREPNKPPALELTAGLLVGSRSMTDLIAEISRGLNDSGENSYTVSLDRSTRLVTISADDIFELLITSGSNAGLSPFSLLGFSGADLTGLSSYTGTAPMGSSYTPQFLPQGFKSFDDNLEGTEASINESAAGIVEVVTFGDRRFMNFNMIYITDLLKGKGNPITNNSSGVQDARDLMEFLIKKSEVEFMINELNVNSFDKVLLESTRKSKSGTSFELKELVNKGFNDHFETGNLKFRKVIS